jgi:hypothetical protein
MERRLWDDGGYLLDNGASLCGQCHLRAEQTVISTDDLRQAAKIIRIVLPSHLYSDHKYDKWGNIVNPNGTRIRGELFFSRTLSKIIPYSIEDMFIPYVKYPRTYHLPWSQSVLKDDRTHTDTSHFTGFEVVVLEKRDGENTTIYFDGYYHARSVDSLSHPSQSWGRREARNWCYDLPRGWRVCGENLYALHSIEYCDLTAYFEVFNIWDKLNNCLSWDDTLEWCELLGLQTVPELYRGIYDEEVIKNLKLDTERQEGYVMRATQSFPYSRFRYLTGKFVRANHVQSTVHNWRRDWRPDMVNKLRI